MKSLLVKWLLRPSRPGPHLKDVVDLEVRGNGGVEDGGKIVEEDLGGLSVARPVVIAGSVADIAVGRGRVRSGRGHFNFRLPVRSVEGNGGDEREYRSGEYLFAVGCD